MYKLLLIASVAAIASAQTDEIAKPIPPPTPTCCGPNEVYLAQGVAPNCDTVCSEIGKECTRVYIWPPFGCYCLPDHARDEKSNCVPIYQCPIKCETLDTSV